MNKINGILLIDKPEGLSSFQICNIIKEKFRFKKVGHGGTLDPFATGLLIVGINKATKILNFFSEALKEYKGTIMLGEKRDSYDITGNIIEIADKKNIFKLNDDIILKTAEDFLGLNMQEPPSYSALKYRGKPLYKYARKGIEIKKEPRKVFIEKFEIVEIDLPEIKFYIKCSKGTYIRAIANDFGERLGTFGFLKSLRRIKVGKFHIDDAVSIDEVENSNIIDLENVFDFKKVYIKPDFNKLLENGNEINLNYIQKNMILENNEYVYLIGTNVLSIAKYDYNNKVFKPEFVYKKSLQ